MPTFMRILTTPLRPFGAPPLQGRQSGKFELGGIMAKYEILQVDMDVQGQAQILDVLGALIS